MTARKESNRQVKRNVAIIDDHPLVCEAIARAIDDEPDLTVCGSAPNIDDAMELIRQQKVDIALVDLSLDRSSGFVLLDLLKRDFPELPTIVLSMHEETTHAARSFQKGARGYVMKNESLGTIIKAIRYVLEGNLWFREELIQQGSQDQNNSQILPQDIPNLLTRRELEIFEMLGNGIPVEEIAKKLFISKRTVESHRDHIKAKLNAPDVLRLHQLAFRWIQGEI